MGAIAGREIVYKPDSEEFAVTKEEARDGSDLYNVYMRVYRWGDWWWKHECVFHTLEEAKDHIKKRLR